MFTVAVTGRSGSGKSSVAQYYASLGYPVVDGDRISREVTRPGSAALKELAEAFGAGIIAGDGSLLRKKLGELVFTCPEYNEKLKAITHPHIIKEILRRRDAAEEKGAKLFFVDGAVIVGAAFEPYCDKIIVVTSGHRLAVSRIMLRDGISKTAAETRLASQTDEAALLQAADYVIENNRDLAMLQQEADVVLQMLLLQIGE